MKYKIYGAFHNANNMTTTVKLQETSNKIFAKMIKRKYKKAGFESLYISTGEEVKTTHNTIIYL